jgi:hypothetical protein
MDTIDPSPLQLATDARVACATLEDQLTRGHHRKALATARKLWHCIDAMAARIEQLTARLEAPAAADIPVVIVDTPEEADRISLERLQPHPATGTLGQRPPGFQTVRARMRQRPNPCALVELPEDIMRRKTKRTNSVDWRNGDQRDLGPAWQRVVDAYLAGRLRDGAVYEIRQIRDLCNVQGVLIEQVQMSLAEHRAPLRLVEHGGAKLRVRAA